MSADVAATARRLLIVDDSRLVLELVRDFFVSHGYEVDRAEQASTALERLAAARPDVIVADILMPGMDGWEFYEQVKRQAETAGIPFVFLTTETRLSTRLRGLRMGADDYLTKPFAVEELHARVERLLARRGASRPDWMPEGALLAGSVEHLPVPDLLQILAVHGRRGVIELREDGRRGRIVFEGDRVTHAEAGRTAGRKALYRLLGWSGATFHVRPLRGDGTRRTLELGVADALMEGMVALDEWERWREGLPDPGMRLEVSEDGDGGPARGEATPAEDEIVARSRRGMTVAEILEDSELTDAELARAICALVDREILRPVL